MIVQLLQRIQKQFGYLPEEQLRAAAAQTGTPLYRLQDVAGFYPHFLREPPPAIKVQVCRDITCQLRGSRQILAQLENEFGQSSTQHGCQVEISGVSCLGRCDRAPVACVTTHHTSCERYDVHASQSYSSLANTVHETVQAVRNDTIESIPLGNCDKDWNPEQSDNWQIDVYRIEPERLPYDAIRQYVSWQTSNGQAQLSGGDNRFDDSFTEELEAGLRFDLRSDFYSDENREQLVDAMRTMPWQQRRIISALFAAGLLGMGGAGGRAYLKWIDVLKAQGDAKYIVCNGDESEPGTFKDRELLIRAPHLVVEGVILAGLVLQAKQGFIYLRHEYPEQIDAVRREIARATELGVCGESILGSELDFPVEVFVSPGGYICGEQTALIEAIEDKRAEPRNRPPELQTNGLWDKPTLLNNVETMSWIPSIVLRDRGRWFAGQGSQTKYKGRRFYSISGDVAKPGAYEVPNGLRLRELVDDYAGGMRDGRTLKAFALSGPSGGFLPRMLPVGFLPERWVKEHLPPDAREFDLLDMELEIDTSRQMGLMLGAGIIVFDDTADMVATAVACTEFYRNESCGKCVPCRIGSQKLAELAKDIANENTTVSQLFGEGSNVGTFGLIKQLADTIRGTSICGLGMVAPNPLTSLLIHFRSDVEAHLSGGKRLH